MARRHSGGTDDHVDTFYGGPTSNAFTIAGHFLYRTWQYDFGGTLQFTEVLKFTLGGGSPAPWSVAISNEPGSPHIRLVQEQSGFEQARFACPGFSTGFWWAIRKSGSTVECWIDGAQVSLQFSDFSNITPNGTAVETRTHENADADAAHVAVWGRALSNAEMAAITGGESPRMYPTNLEYYRTHETSGQDEWISGNPVSSTSGGSYLSGPTVSVSGDAGVNGTGDLSFTANSAVNDFSVDGVGALSIAARMGIVETIPVDGVAALSFDAVVSGPSSTDFYINRNTQLQDWYGFRATDDAFESDSPIVADIGGNTGFKWDIPDAIYDSLNTTIAQAGLSHMRQDIHATRSQDGGTFGGSGPGGTGYTAGPYVSSGYSVDDDVTDAKVDAWLRFKAAVQAEGRTPWWSIQCVFWDDDGIHDDPPGDPGQNAVDFIMSFLERARTVYGEVPDVLTWVNEPDLVTAATVSPAQLARSFDKLLTALDAVAGQPYANMRIAFPEVTGTIDNLGNPVGAYTIANYLDEIQNNYPSRMSRIDWLGFHPYPDGNESAGGLASVWTDAQTYGIAETAQGEFWSVAGAREDIYRQITDARASLIEIFTRGTFPQTGAPGATDWGRLQSSAINGWGSQISGYVLGPRESDLRPYVKYLQPGAVRLDVTINGSPGVRGTAWELTDGRIVAVVEDTSGAANTYSIGGVPSSTHDVIHVDDGTTISKVTDPSNVSIGANGLHAVVFHPVAVASVGGVSDIDASGARTRTGDFDVNGASTVDLTAIRDRIGAASVVGASVIGFTGARTRSVAAAITGASSVGVTGARTITGDFGVDGSGTVAPGLGVRIRRSGVAIDGLSVLSITPATIGSAFTVSAGATLSANGARHIVGGVSVDGAGGVTADGQVAAPNVVIGAVGIDGVGALTGDGVRTRSGAFGISAAGAIVGTSARARTGTVGIAGDGDIAGTAALRFAVGLGLSATGSIAVSLAGPMTGPPIVLESWVGAPVVLNAWRTPEKGEF